MKFQDISGKKFGRLKAVGVVGKTSDGYFLWEFTCDCGAVVYLKSGTVKSGNTLSCGCLQRDSNVSRWTKHGHSPEGKTSPTYNSWYAMKARCSNPKNKCYNSYGGAGIKVCKRWYKFKNFLKDMGKRPAGTVLGRHGDVGDYKPSNCSWQTHEEDTHTRREKRKTNAIHI